MSSTLERYDVAVSGFRRRLEPLAPTDFARPSPCKGWTAGDLLDHTIGAVVLVAGLVGDTVLDTRSDGFLARFDRATEDLRTKVADPEARRDGRREPVRHARDQAAREQHRRARSLVHTWDLARATGGDERLDDEPVAHTYASMSPLDDMLREHGFATKVDAPEGADAQTELLCFLGRQP